MSTLTGKVVIVTGGAQGMGAATATLLTEQGARVVVADIAVDHGKTLVSGLGETATFCPLDVTSEADWQAVLSHTLEHHGSVSALVNNAGINYFSGVLDIEEKNVMQVLSINVLGAMLGVKTIAPSIKKSGSGAIVNISSLDGLRAVNGLSAYVASKWALRGLTKAQALELGPDIRVNSVHPGGVDTPLGNPSGLTGEELNRPYMRVPLRRIGEPNEIASATAFLISDASSYITGAELAVDGGWTAGYYHAGLPGGPEVN